MEATQKRNPKTQELLRDLVTEFVTAGSRLKNMGFKVIDYNIQTHTAVIETPTGDYETLEMS